MVQLFTFLGVLLNTSSFTKIHTLETFYGADTETMRRVAEWLTWNA